MRGMIWRKLLYTRMNTIDRTRNKYERPIPQPNSWEVTLSPTKIETARSLKSRCNQNILRVLHFNQKPIVSQRDILRKPRQNVQKQNRHRETNPSLNRDKYFVLSCWTKPKRINILQTPVVFYKIQFETKYVKPNITNQLLLRTCTYSFLHEKKETVNRTLTKWIVLRYKHNSS